ncbi:MAG: type II CRISPR-associated endonuclease Cas1 [Lachnospiraceae bacterium]|nr:type II CRISPR-associated endonuclease Cas1 [Lachnospiraceae bacterium]
MSWRTIVVSSASKLDYQLGFLVVRGEETVKIHINEIEMLIVESTAVSLTAYLLNELIRHKVKVIFCDEKRNPSSELLPYYGSHDTSTKIRHQMEWRAEEKAAVWTEIVTEKIRQQADLLAELHKPEEALLRKYLTEISFGDETNREGHAAKVYFNALFGKDFTRSEECPVNAALNYGYSIILSLFTREITANGYITQIGMFHDNMFNPFNLASDLMEPFRPIVDRMVIHIMPDVFEKDEKHKILELLNKEIHINGHTEYLGNAVKIYTRSIFEALNDKDVSLIKFYDYEL